MDTQAQLNELSPHEMRYLESYPRGLAMVAQRFRSDPKVVLLAVRLHGAGLEFASDEMKDTFEIVSAAVRSFPMALKFASHRLKADCSLVLDAVNLDGLALRFASPELRNTITIIDVAISNNITAIQFASDELKENRDLMYKVVFRKGAMLRYVSPELKNDYELVSQAVKQKSENLQYASENLKRNPQLVLLAMQRNVDCVKYAPSDLLEDRSFALRAVRVNNRAYFAFSDLIKHDMWVLTVAIASKGADLYKSKIIQAYEKKRLVEFVQEQLHSFSVLKSSFFALLHVLNHRDWKECNKECENALHGINETADEQSKPKMQTCSLRMIGKLGPYGVLTFKKKVFEFAGVQSGDTWKIVSRAARRLNLVQ